MIHTLYRRATHTFHTLVFSGTLIVGTSLTPPPRPPQLCRLPFLLPAHRTGNDRGQAARGQVGQGRMAKVVRQDRQHCSKAPQGVVLLEVLMPAPFFIGCLHH